MTEEKFKLPGSSYDELCKIIRSYGFFDKPFTLDEASQVTKMHRSQVSRNNGFLGAVGIIEGDKTKTTTTLGKRLARALDFERGDEIAAAWREIVSTSEFLSKMLAAVKIRKGMDEATLQSHIAYSAGQQKTREVLAGARAIIEILQSAELLLEKDGQLIPTDSDKNQIVQANINAPTTSQAVTVESPTKTQISYISQAPSGISINIQIQINVTSAEIDELGPKLKKLLDDISLDSVSRNSNQSY
jgi:hypothetical protein